MPAQSQVSPDPMRSTAPSTDPGERSALSAATFAGARASAQQGLPPSDAALADGVSLGRYELRAVLGSGATGTVYRAHDPRLDREVALKVLDGVSGSHGADAVAEARNIARIDHPNVVTVYDAGAARGRLWVAMQLVEGGTLAARARAPEVDLPDLLALLLAVGEGLAAAHGRGVVHRDVKPDNILIDGRGVAKLADFGLASRDSATSAGRAGTPGFMAPEVQAGGEASPRSDQYSWCATAAWLARVQGVAFDPAVQRVVDRGLLADPAHRWPSMRALLEAFGAVRLGGGDPQIRASIIARVEEAWIEGVLAPSLATVAPVPLPLEWRPDLVAGVAAGRACVSLGSAPWPETLDLEGRALERLFGASGRSLLVAGEPGAGKTTAVLAWVRRRLALARRHGDARVPIVFSLASFRGGRPGGLAAWCVDQLVERYGLPRAAAQLWIDGGHAVLVLDGLDEVPLGHRATAAQAVTELGAARDQPMVVVCRHGELLALPERPALGGAVLLAPLDDASLRRLGLDEEELRQIDGRARLPLWVALGLLDRGRDGDGGRGPLERWITDTLRRGTTRARDPRAALGTLARLMSRKGVSQLVLEDLEFADLPGPWSRGWIALAWGALAVVGMVSVNLVAAVAGGRSALAGGVFGVAAVLAVLIVQRGRPVKMTERLAWSWRRALAWTPISVAFSAFMGLVFGLLVGTPAMSVALGAQFGLLIPAVIALEPSALPSRVEANAGFRSSVRHALTIGLATAAAFGLFFSTVAVPLLEPLFGPPGGPVLPADLSIKLAWEMSAVAGTVSLAVFGGRAAGRHLALRLGLAVSTPIPLRLVAWLDTLVEDGLMRRVGGAYQFRHPTVLEHLAGRTTSSAAGTSPP